MKISIPTKEGSISLSLSAHHVCIDIQPPKQTLSRTEAHKLAKALELLAQYADTHAL